MSDERTAQATRRSEKYQTMVANIAMNEAVGVKATNEQNSRQAGILSSIGSVFVYKYLILSAHCYALNGRNTRIEESSTSKPFVIATSIARIFLAKQERSLYTKFVSRAIKSL